jgi:hypothetical protein
MFLTDCHTCRLRELRGTRSIETLVHTYSGIGLVYRCTRCETLNVSGPTNAASTAAAATA